MPSPAPPTSTRSATSSVTGTPSAAGGPAGRRGWRGGARADASPRAADEYQVSALRRAGDASRRGRARRSTGLAGVSTVVFLVVVGFAIVNSPGWERVKESFFDKAIAKESLKPIL